MSKREPGTRWYSVHLGGPAKIEHLKVRTSCAEGLSRIFDFDDAIGRANRTRRGFGFETDQVEIAQDFERACAVYQAEVTDAEIRLKLAEAARLEAEAQKLAAEALLMRARAEAARHSALLETMENRFQQAHEATGSPVAVGPDVYKQLVGMRFCRMSPESDESTSGPKTESESLAQLRRELQKALNVQFEVQMTPIPKIKEIKFKGE